MGRDNKPQGREGRQGTGLTPFLSLSRSTRQIPGLKTLCHNCANRRDLIKENRYKLTFMRELKHLVMPAPQPFHWASVTHPAL